MGDRAKWTSDPSPGWLGGGINPPNPSGFAWPDLRTAPGTHTPPGAHWPLGWCEARLWALGRLHDKQTTCPHQSRVFVRSNCLALKGPGYKAGWFLGRIRHCPFVVSQSTYRWGLATGVGAPELRWQEAAQIPWIKPTGGDCGYFTPPTGWSEVTNMSRITNTPSGLV